MNKNFNTMIVINLHEPEYLKEVLECLAEEYVHETLVMDAESIQSRHDNNFPSISFILQTIKDDNLNNFVTAVLNKEQIPSLAERLKNVKTNDRYACSFWFIPIEGYFWHKADI